MYHGDNLLPVSGVPKKQELVETDLFLDGILARYMPLPRAIREQRCDPNGQDENVLDFLRELQAGFAQEEISVMNRNARRPRKANKGARPCSRSSRRWKKEQIGKRSRGGRK